jgi:predicted DsbA family dithiol-disulfide isomerase
VSWFRRARYFENAANIADRNVLLRVASEVGLEDAETYLNSDEDKDRIEAEYESALKERIGGVPFYKIRGSDESAAPVKLSGAQPPEAFEEAFDEVTD